jgi:DNA phosphorothioation-dependent restriction protein DptF
MSITLRKALSVLGKSSPFSVSTVSDKSSDELTIYKDQLYVQQDIEKEFAERAEGLGAGGIIFLCGSSGDGKSEILTRFYHKHKHDCDFHLDATHSFAPHETAIQALDKLFDGFNLSERPLILGINVGMLANYSKEGADRHGKIRESIEAFLSRNVDKVGNYHFLDFENFSKFNFMSDTDSYSQFAEELIDRLSRREESNPFYLRALEAESTGLEKKLTANFKLLSMTSVRKVIITQLFKARLLKDQFITTRALLDLLHHLLTGNRYISDNLYLGAANELVNRVSEFDPALLRTKALDDFILRYELGLPDEELDVFIEQISILNLQFSRTDVQQGDAASLIRLFSMLRDQDISNNYHFRFREEFAEHSLLSYSKVWNLHLRFDGGSENKKELRRFYNNDFITALLRYANRNAPELQGKRDEIYLGTFGTVNLAAVIDIKVDVDGLAHIKREKGMYFNSPLKILDKSLKLLPFTFSLFQLVEKINCGYRPNKYDKNTVVVLDDIVENIKSMARKHGALKLYESGAAYTAKMDEDMVIVNKVA